MRPDVQEFFCGISFDAYRLLGSPPAGPGRGWLLYRGKVEIKKYAFAADAQTAQSMV